MPPVKRYGSSCRTWRNFLPIDSIYEGASSPKPGPPASARWRTSGSRCAIRSRRRNSGSRRFRTPGSLGERPCRYAIARIRRLVSWLRSLSSEDSRRVARGIQRRRPGQVEQGLGAARTVVGRLELVRASRTAGRPALNAAQVIVGILNLGPTATSSLHGRSSLSSTTHEVQQEAGHEPQQAENTWILATIRKGFLDLVRRFRLTVWQVFIGQIVHN